MKMSKNSPENASGQMELPSIASWAASHARTSARLGEALASKVSVRVYGRNTPASLASFDRDTSSWRTFQLCLVEGWPEFSETWPRSGMMRNGTAYQLEPLAPLTSGIDCGLWPTPTVVFTRENWTAEQIAERQQQVKAETRAKGKHHTGNGFGLNLAQAARLWPTPIRRDGRTFLGARRSPNAVGSEPLVIQVGGKLNPPWVAWLMGFPVTWTDGVSVPSKATETP
jgi:hypothetical protein